MDRAPRIVGSWSTITVVLVIGLGVASFFGNLANPLHPQTAEAAQPAAIAAMAPGTWLAVPNSHMRSVAYSGPLAASIRAVEGPSAVMSSQVMGAGTAL